MGPYTTCVGNMLKSIQGTNPPKGPDVKAIQPGFQGIDQVQGFCRKECRFDRGIVATEVSRETLWWWQQWLCIKLYQALCDTATKTYSISKIPLVVCLYHKRHIPLQKALILGKCLMLKMSVMVMIWNTFHFKVL